jgi:AcrR family transcriptional regulator
MDMLIPYESTGRSRQKARTRAAMLAATRALLADGVMNPTVEEVADRALVSRTTAYRYFPNQHALLVASYPVLDMPSLLGDDPPDDVFARLDIVLEEMARQLRDYEPELRTMLRLSLESRPGKREALPLRQGRAIRWLQDALAPLRDRLPAAEIRRLAFAIRAAFGLEALVWLTDIAGISRTQATALMRSSARAILRCALIDAGIDHGGKRQTKRSGS